MKYEEKLKERFDKEFKGCLLYGNEEDAEYDVWSFISQSLSNYKKELMEAARDIDKSYSLFRYGEAGIIKPEMEARLREIMAVAESLLQKDKEVNK